MIRFSYTRQTGNRSACLRAAAIAAVLAIGGPVALADTDNVPTPPAAANGTDGNPPTAGQNGTSITPNASSTDASNEASGTAGAGETAATRAFPTPVPREATAETPLPPPNRRHIRQLLLA